MKKNVINEINQMKFLFDYKSGKLLSENPIRPWVKVGIAEATTLALKNSLQVIDYFAQGKLTLKELQSSIDEIIDPIAKNLDEADAITFRRNVKEKIDQIGSVRSKSDDIKIFVQSEINVLKKRLDDMDADVRIKISELEIKYTKIKENILNTLSTRPGFISAWKDMITKVLKEVSDKGMTYGDMLISKCGSIKTLREQIKNALIVNDEGYLNISTLSAKEKEAIKKAFTDTLDDRVEFAMNELRQTEAYKNKYGLTKNEIDLRLSELDNNYSNRYTNLQNKGDNLTDVERRELSFYNEYFKGKITGEELVTKLMFFDDVETIVGKGNYQRYESISQKPQDTRTPEENFLIRQVQDVTDKKITPEQAKRRVENFDRLDAKERAYYNEVVNKTTKTKEETLYVTVVDDIVNNYTTGKHNYVRKTKYKSQGIIEKWWQNNALLNFYTNYIRPMFGPIIDRFLAIYRRTFGFTPKTLEQLQARLYSALEKNANKTEITTTSAPLRRFIQDFLEYPQSYAGKNVPEGSPLNYEQLLKQIKDGLEGKLSDSDDALLNQWIENVRHLESRKNISLDEILTGTPSKMKGASTDEVKNTIKRFAMQTVSPVWGVIKSLPSKFLNLILFGRYKNPRDFQRQMYQRAIDSKNWKQKKFGSVDEDMIDFWRSDAAKSLAYSYGITYFALPVLVVGLEFIKDVIMSWITEIDQIEDFTYYAESFVEEFLSLPLTVFWREYDENDLVMLELVTSISPNFIDNSILNIVNLYRDTTIYSSQEEKIAVQTKEDIINIFNSEKNNVKEYNDKSQFTEIDFKPYKSQSFDVNRKTNAPFFLSKERVIEGEFSDNFRISMIKYLQPKNKNYRIIKSPLGANPFVLFELYKQKVINKKEDQNYLQKAKDFFNSVLTDPSTLPKAIEGLPQQTKDNIPFIQPQIKKNGKHYTLIMVNSKIYYYVTDYETLINAIQNGNFENVDDLLVKKPIKEFASINENYLNIKNMNNMILEKIKKVIMEEEEEKTLKMKDWDEIFTFQKIDEKNPGKYTDVKIKMDSVMDRMPHWRKKYNKQCEELENCDDDGEDDSFVRAVIDTHPEVVRILFTKSLAHLTSSDDQEDLNEGLHLLLKVIRESKNVEVEVWSVYRHPSSPEKIWSLVKGDYKPKELQSMDMKMQQSPQNNVEKKKNSLDELKKKEDDAIKHLSVDEKKGLLDLPIKIRSKIKEKIKKGWTTEKPEESMSSFFKEDEVDSVFSNPIKIYKLKPGSDFIDYIEKENISGNIKRGFCRAIFYLERERDFKEKTKEKIDSILDKCENKFDGKYGQNYL